MATPDCFTVLGVRSRLRPVVAVVVSAAVFAAPGSASAHPSPHVKTRAAGSNALPYTGVDPGWTALAGLGLLAAGGGLRTRVRTRTPGD
jgi:LPXTG-motif cell wall-anchored protein